METSILELWAHDGSYDSQTDLEIEKLTKDEIIEKINNYNRYYLIPSHILNQKSSLSFFELQTNQCERVRRRVSNLGWRTRYTGLAARLCLQNEATFYDHVQLSYHSHVLKNKLKKTFSEVEFS